jgi:hypothetical protein
MWIAAAELCIYKESIVYPCEAANYKLAVAYKWK